MDDRLVLPFRAKVGAADGLPAGRRMGWLTPYEVEILRSEARRSGAGTQLELFVPARSSDEGVDWVRAELDSLRRDGVRVSVKRDAAWEFRSLPSSASRSRRA
ncbi:MAG: hypothetical protein ACKOCT_20300 [Alphaproteobacteria bacterium]